MAAKNICSMVSFNIITPGGPSLAYHVGCIIGSKLFVHGGINKRGSTTPLDTLYRYDFNTGTWQRISSPDSPALSHHACVIIQNRYITLIGGWNGKSRTSDIHVYDIANNHWMHPKATGFPAGAGLSSHAAVLLSTRDILVQGREGSLRMQRRFSSTFILSVDIDKGIFNYSECSNSTASRSGHTLTIIGSTAAVIGGRDDKVLEVDSVKNEASPPSCSKLSNLESMASLAAPVPKGMTARRHHVAVCCGRGSIFVHGGLTFDGRHKEPMSDMYLLLLKPRMLWYALGDSGVGLAGHVCCFNGERVIIHGGEGSRGNINCSTFELQTV